MINKKSLLIVIVFTGFVVLGSFLYLRDKESNLTSDESASVESTTTAQSPVLSKETSKGVATSTTSGIQKTTPKSVSPATPPIQIRGEVVGIASTISTVEPQETQYRVNVVTSNSIVIHVGSQIVISSLGCNLNVRYIPGPFWFEGLSYNSQYGWYNCKTGTSLAIYD